jgi:hypothetical protein
MSASPNRQADQPEGGVVQELARDDVERKKFLKMAGKTMGTGAAATGLAAFIAACGGSSSSSSSSGGSSSAAASSSSASTSASSTASDTSDLAVVNYALTLEYLEAQFYDKVVASGLFSGQNLSVIKTFRMDEHEHVGALMSVASKLGKPAAVPKGKFPLQSAGQVTKLAAAVENLGASAYLGQAGNIKSKEILAAALSIHTIEARHAAVFNTLLKMSPTPDGAFAKPMSMSQVLAAVKPVIA